MLVKVVEEHSGEGDRDMVDDARGDGAKHDDGVGAVVKNERDDHVEWTAVRWGVRSGGLEEHQDAEEWVVVEPVEKDDCMCRALLPALRDGSRRTG